MKRRDSQRDKVYEWERSLGIDEMPMSMQAITELVARICVDYGKRMIEISDGRRRRRGAGGIGFAGAWIKLPRFARHRYYVLHEVAHAIVSVDPPHGPEYARFLAELFERYADVPMRTLRTAATTHRVRWAPSSAVPKPLSREERKLRDEVKRTREAYSRATTALDEYRTARKKRRDA